MGSPVTEASPPGRPAAPMHLACTCVLGDHGLAMPLSGGHTRTRSRRDALRWRGAHTGPVKGSAWDLCVSTHVFRVLGAYVSVRICECAVCGVPVGVGLPDVCECISHGAGSALAASLAVWGALVQGPGSQVGCGAPVRGGQTAPCFCSRLPALPSALSCCQRAEALGSSRGSARHKRPPAPLPAAPRW